MWQVPGGGGQARKTNSAGTQKLYNQDMLYIYLYGRISFSWQYLGKLLGPLEGMKVWEKGQLGKSYFHVELLQNQLSDFNQTR